MKALFGVICLLSFLATPLAQNGGATEAKASPELSEIYQIASQMRLHFHAGNFNEARPLAERAIQLADKAPDASPLIQADVRGNLAEVMIGQKQYAQAAPLYKDALSRYEKAGSNTFLKQLQVLDRLVFIYSQLNAYKEAETFSDRCVALCEKSFGADSPHLIVAFATRAQVELRQGNYGTASRFFDRARQLGEKHNGPQELTTGQLMESAAWSLFYDGGNNKTIEDGLRLALEIKTKKLGENTLEVKTTLLRLANFYRYQGRPQEADLFFLRAIAVEDSLPPEKDTDGSPNALTQYDCFLKATQQTSKQKAFFAQRAANRKKVTDDADKGTVLNGRAIELPKPEYPLAAREARISGTISVQVTIDEQGRVIKARSICGGFLPLSEAAVAAARKARFSPTLLNGKPVVVTGVINYNFVAVR